MHNRLITVANNQINNRWAPARYIKERMIMKKIVKNKVLAAVLAAVCAASAVSAVSIMSASAAGAFSQAIASQNSQKGTVIVKRTDRNVSTIPMKGEDWTYYADSLYAKIGCDYDYYHHICHFYFTGIKAGTTNAVLKTQRTDGKWDNTPIAIRVFNDLTMTITQTGDAYVTEKSSTDSYPEPFISVPPTSDDKPVTKAGTAAFSLAGEDWTYYANTLYVKVSCDYDYQNSVCNFKFTAVKPGTTTSVILKTQRKDGKWNNTPVLVVVNTDMTVTVKQSGAPYVTEFSYTK